MQQINTFSAPLIDQRFNVLSYDQYLLDLDARQFKKMCMTQIMNADMMIATFGEATYNNSIREVLQGVVFACTQMGIDSSVEVYSNTYKNFIVAADDTISNKDFLGLMKAFYDQYELSTSQQTEIGGLSRFVVVFGDDLVDRAKSAYYLNRNHQNNFIIVSNEKERLLAEHQRETEMFSLLNYAVSNNQVVPFYQGIYNNTSGAIKRYEALMRIYDKDGKLYTPGQFLSDAKRLKLYLPMSKIMIDKALTNFVGKQSELSLNISLFDIQSVDFRRWFLDRIKRHPSPEKVIVEFVETENYNNDNLLIRFLSQVRKIGCKIAVDDFGAGFATYSSIIALRPDIIKIDGEIIKNLTKNEESKIILDSICYMARLIGSTIIAEFVEDAEIQEVVMDNQIHYSQGYHFAKPALFEQLSVK